jgi:excinuclease ABC subunit A
VESLSAYARQFLEQMEKPDVDLIDGLSPAISIEQKTTGSNPRSTVGTVTEIYDYLRLLFANVGVPHCPSCDREISSQSLDRIIGMVMQYPPDERINVLAPLVRGRKGEFKRELADLRSQGYTRARIDGSFVALEHDIALDRRRNHDIYVLVDRLIVKAGRRAAADRIDRTRDAPGRRDCRHQHPRGWRSVVFAQDGVSGLRRKHSGNVATSVFVQLASRRLPGMPGSWCHLRFRSETHRSGREACRCQPARFCRGPRATRASSTDLLAGLTRAWSIDSTVAFAKLPKKLRDIVLFGAPGKRSSNGASKGKAPKDPFGVDFEGVVPNLRRRFDEGTWTDQEALEPYRALQPCPACEGARLRPESRAVRVKGRRLAEFVQLPISDVFPMVEALELNERESLIAARVVKEVASGSSFLVDVGVGYLTLGRSAATLSGGEGQRIRLATQIGSQLTGVLYVLDEPSIGLHQRDNRRLLATLGKLRNLGNTVLVVEHDEETIRTADYLIDLGPWRR